MTAFADAWGRIAIVLNWQRFTQQALAVLAEEYRVVACAKGRRAPWGIGKSA